MVIDILFFIGSLILLRKFLVGMDSVSSPVSTLQGRVWVGVAIKKVTCS